MIQIGDIKAYNVAELSKLLKITEKTVRDYCIQKKLRAKKIGRNWYVTEEALKEFFETSEQKGPNHGPGSDK